MQTSYKRCAEQHWLNQHPSTAEGCMALVLADPSCSHRFFNYAAHGDKNCGCVERGRTCTSLVTATRANFYIISSVSGMRCMHACVACVARVACARCTPKRDTPPVLLPLRVCAVSLGHTDLSYHRAIVCALVRLCACALVRLCARRSVRLCVLCACASPQ